MKVNDPAWEMENLFSGPSLILGQCVKARWSGSWIGVGGAFLPLPPRKPVAAGEVCVPKAFRSPKI